MTAIHDAEFFRSKALAALDQAFKLELFIAGVRAELDDRPAEDIVASIRDAFKYWDWQKEQS